MDHKTVIVTGGAGFIGSHIVEEFLSHGHKVVVIDNLSTGSLDNLIDMDVQVIQQDICDLPAMREIFQEFKPDWVSHQAAHMELRVSVDDPLHDLKTNVLGSTVILELCREFKVQHLSMASSGGAIYGKSLPIEGPSSEYRELCPISPYGASKASMEIYASTYERLHGMSITMHRYANVYGPRQRSNGEAGIIAIFLDAWKSGKTPTINGTGNQVRDYIYVKDVSKAVVASHTHALQGIYNIGTTTGTDVSSLVSHLKKIIVDLQIDLDTSVLHGPEKLGDVLYNVIDVSKFSNFYRKKTSNSFNITTLEQGLEKTVRSYYSL